MNTSNKITLSMSQALRRIMLSMSRALRKKFAPLVVIAVYFVGVKLIFVGFGWVAVVVVIAAVFVVDIVVMPFAHDLALARRKRQRGSETL